jgi:hypothetical protein
MLFAKGSYKFQLSINPALAIGVSALQALKFPTDSSNPVFQLEMLELQDLLLALPGNLSEEVEYLAMEVPPELVSPVTRSLFLLEVIETPRPVAVLEIFVRGATFALSKL